MRIYTVAILACIAMGCSQESAQNDTTDDSFDAEPAGFTVHPAEASGYIEATDPNAYPSTPADSSGPIEDW